jgi:virulence-associated protein VapD
VQEIILNLNKLFQTFKTFYYFLTHIQNTIYVDIGKNYKKNHLIQLLNIIKQLKDFKCTIIQIQMIYLELLLKFHDSLNNSQIFKLIIHQNSDIQKLLAMEVNSQILVF